ncbi:hypothetical protein L1987_55290 [Smallanthus sonchifolius]|uniref:Uncharacterized protein n=1 Tax=Smallanthus sonchifolius TaxID=185202 RepID=A0ACB9E980_9ASTR|nr:hypothetical protein L1987_55290 [Smallanthus sonchifolius]
MAVTTSISMALSLITTTTIFLLTPPFAAPLSFQKTGFSPNDGDITYERDAYPSNNAIQLTNNQRDVRALVSIGRATYSEPLHLWDHGSRNLTDFSTRFTFTINSLNSSKYGDGLAFFLAPNGSTVPDNVSNSGTLGLTRNDEVLNSSGNPFVAVEFDVFQNMWDPKGEHVGIDISSMDSVRNVTWRSRIREGETYEAVIRYDSSLKNLSVVFTGFSQTSTLHQRISYIVDLRDHLPEWVAFGFSGATGNTAVIHSIYTWDFSASLGINENTMNPGTVANPGPGPETRPKPDKSKAGLVAGLMVGCVLLTGLVLVLFMLRKRKNEFKAEDDFHKAAKHRALAMAITQILQSKCLILLQYPVVFLSVETKC